MISFVVPAYNEADFLGPTLEAIHAAGRALGRPYEIVVADDASTDGTAALAESMGARVVACEHRQIAGTRNSGAAEARGEFLIFVDADTRVSPDVVRAAVDALDRGAVGGGAPVRWDRPVAFIWRVFVRMLGIAFRVTRWAAGSFLFCRRDAFEAVGGFDERLYAAEEIWLSRALKRHGRFVVLREGVATSSRKLETHSSWQVLRTLLTVLLRPRGLRRRQGLELWYEQRQNPGQ
jgi:glycosyltransferase involved in cell wall biosynthesis